MSFNIVFIDYVLGQHDGLDLMRELLRNGLKAPVIMLTGRGSREIDIQAMRDGAADYLEKGHLNASLLERSMRYAIERARNLERVQAQGIQLRNLSQKLVEVQEKERTRIARELHDSIGSSLSAIKYVLEDKLHRLDGKDPDKEGIPLQEIISWVKDTIHENQRICTDLRPRVLDDLGIFTTIRWACRRFQEAYSNIWIDLHLDAQEDLIPASLKVVLYRIVQEALNNAAKHSSAKTVLLSLKATPDGLELIIQDDGQGFDPLDPVGNKTSPKGLGLEGMRDRTEISSGLFSLESAPGKGTRIRCFWPLS